MAVLGLLIRGKLNLEHFCGAPFVLSSCGHCYKEGERPNASVCPFVWSQRFLVLSLPFLKEAAQREIGGQD